ncbi:MAG: universal stress protein [Chloroflexi bacterium]|nr:universal stress protein [Chloroflexota bacterium]
MSSFSPTNVPSLDRRIQVVQDFRQARNRARLQEIFSRFSGRSNELLSYEEIRQKLRAQGSSEIGLQNVPLDAIVGSLGRYSDFTRDFLPRLDAAEDRWVKVKLAAEGDVGLPPIEVYKIGEAYFVKDGNHRVSVARLQNAKTIQAYVTEVLSRVPITPDIQPDDLILKAEYVGFLEQTRLDESHPDADLTVTAPGQYPALEEHISVHRYYLGLEQQRDVTYPEAASHWYNEVYLPVIGLIREYGILRNFPGRTETDLYLWMAEYRAALEKEWGEGLPAVVIAQEIAPQPPPAESLLARLGGKILEVVSPRKLETGPPPGQWRERALAHHPADRLFSDILVPLSGSADSWLALEQAQVFARREEARIHALHVAADEEARLSPAVAKIEAEFTRRCPEGHFLAALGETAPQIAQQSRFTDLVVVNLLYPPPAQPLARLDSGFHDLLHRSPRPILAISGSVTPLQSALLAYDGSPKADEALFVAAYLAESWGMALTVLTAFTEDRPAPETLLRARVYLEGKGIQAAYLPVQGEPGQAIVDISRHLNVDLIIMGGYGSPLLLEVILDSSVNIVLNAERSQPVLICR